MEFSGEPNGLDAENMPGYPGGHCKHKVFQVVLSQIYLCAFCLFLIKLVFNLSPDPFFLYYLSVVLCFTCCL